MFRGGLGEGGEDAAHVGEALGHAGEGVVAVDFVFEHDAAGVVNFLEVFEDGDDGEDAVADVALGVFAEGIFEVLDVHVEEAGAGELEGFEDVLAGAGFVADVAAYADAGVHIFHHGEGIAAGGEVFVFGAVVVDGDFDVVLFDEFFEHGESFVGGGGDDEGHAGAFGVFEVGADVVIVFLVEGDSAAAEDCEAGVFKLFAAAVDVVGLGYVGEVEFLDIDELDAELFGGFDGEVAAEFAEGVAGDAEFDGVRGRGRGGLSESERGGGGGGGRQEGAPVGHMGTFYDRS